MIHAYEFASVYVTALGVIKFVDYREVGYNAVEGHTHTNRQEQSNVK